jgi:NAD(P)H dehydrogenase (quinone)
MTILVTGASGHYGRLAIESLLAKGVPASEIVAGARTPAKAEGLGVRVVPLDYTDPTSIDTALEGVDSLLLVSSSEIGQRAAQHANAIAAAVRAGVKHLVYTSAPAATTSALILAPEHKATEEAIAASGIPATILRNAWYTENYLGTLATARETGAVLTSAGDGRVSSASRKDYAEAAAVVLSEPGHIGQVYELSGDTAWSFAEFAETAAGIIGSPVALHSVTPEEHAVALAGFGLDEGTVGFVVALDGNIRDGLLGVTSGDLSRLIGRPTTPLAAGLAA